MLDVPNTTDPLICWFVDLVGLPSGKLSHNYGKSPSLMGKSAISMAIFNSYVWHNQRVNPFPFFLVHFLFFDG